jgi:hypothetical protein
VARERQHEHVPGTEAAARAELQRAGERDGGGGLGEDALGAGEEAVRGHDLLVGARLDGAAGLVARGDGALPAGGVADADGAGQRVRLLDDLAEHDRRGAGGLEAHHARPRLDPTELLVLAVAAPVRRDVARVAHRQEVVVRRPPERVADLERGRLLPLDAGRVHGVHQLEARRVALLHVADEAQRLVEVALDLDDAGAVHHGLGQLPERDLAVGHHDVGAEPPRAA